MIERRSFITGLIALVAAPAIVRAGSLMPIRQMRISMRCITQYCPFPFEPLDIVYGTIPIQPDYAALMLKTPYIKTNLGWVRA